MEYDIETGYSFNHHDRERKRMIENELGLTCTIINHRTILVTDGGKKYSYIQVDILFKRSLRKEAMYQIQLY